MVLKNGLVSLPDPSKLIDGWFPAPYNLPNTIYEQVNTYLKDTDAGKAFKGGKSFLLSGHIKNVITHSINSNIRYCFVKGLCHPEQNLGQNPYTELFGTVVNGKFTCAVGYVKFHFSKFLMIIRAR